MTLLHIDNELTDEFLADWLSVFEPQETNEKPNYSTLKHFKDLYHWHINARLDEDLTFKPRTREQKLELELKQARLKLYAQSLHTVNEAKTILNMQALAKDKKTSKEINAEKRSVLYKKLKEATNCIEYAPDRLKSVHKKLKKKTDEKYTKDLHECIGFLVEDGTTIVDGLVQNHFYTKVNTKRTVNEEHLDQLLVLMMFALLIKVSVLLREYKTIEDDRSNHYRWKLFEMCSAILQIVSIDNNIWERVNELGEFNSQELL
jgi:hypothetical protein